MADLLARLPLLLALAALAAPAVVHAQTAWKPERNVEILVGVAPGAGTDKTARMIQKVWQQEKTLDVPTVVVNRPGGLMHIPANTLHTIVATPEEDVVFFMVKEKTPMGTAGIPEDPNVTGPRYEPGFEPKKA